MVQALSAVTPGERGWSALVFLVAAAGRPAGPACAAKPHAARTRLGAYTRDTAHLLGHCLHGAQETIVTGTGVLCLF